MLESSAVIKRPMIARRTKNLVDAHRRNCWSVNAERLSTLALVMAKTAISSGDDTTHFKSVQARHDSAFHDTFYCSIISLNFGQDLKLQSQPDKRRRLQLVSAFLTNTGLDFAIAVAASFSRGC